MKILMIAPEPFFEPRGTPFSEYFRIQALTAMGHVETARIVFGWISDRRFDDGAYWAGFTVPDLRRWPEDKFTWTSAGVLLAADALFALTPAARLFSHRDWSRTA